MIPRVLASTIVACLLVMFFCMVEESANGKRKSIAMVGGGAFMLALLSGAGLALWRIWR